MKRVFGSVVVVAFQIIFYAKIYVNDFFYFLKIIFDISTSKRFKKYKPHSILTKKNIKIQSKAGWTAEPNAPEHYISRLYKVSEAEIICRHIILLTSLISSKQGFIKTANVLNHGTKLSRTSLKFKLCRSDKSYVW